MTKHRIVVINDDSVARGGTAVLAVMSAKALAARGHEVIWLCGDVGDNPDLAAHGIEVVALGSRPLLDLPAKRALIEGLHNRAARDMVAGFIAARDTPDTVYHVHSWAQIFSPAIFSGLARVSRRVLLHAHDSFLACPNGVYMDYRKNLACARVPNSFDCITTHCDKRSYAQKLWRVAREARVHWGLGDLGEWGGIVAIHPAMVPKLTRAGYREDKVFTLRNPVVPFSRERIRAEENRALLYLGRIEEDKGAGALAEAAARAEVPLIMLGEGPMKAELAARFPGAEMVGWVDKAGIGAHAARARALVMPSRHPEPFALVIAEAVASGLPVLAADTAAVAGEVEAGGLGYAFDVFDPASFDRAIARIMALTPEEVKAMSERGFSGEAALGNTPEGWIDGLEAQYARVLREVEDAGA
ncbi:MAG: group 1 glycosyl transferase [Rhodobacterales bacterium]|nr:MAG: group 1 glycosyl transferase [Rhodobacterales bacterium]